MPKGRITLVIEYKIDLSLYPPGFTYEDAVKLDEDNDAIFAFIETGDVENVKYELIEEE